MWWSLSYTEKDLKQNDSTPVTLQESKGRTMSQTSHILCANVNQALKALFIHHTIFHKYVSIVYLSPGEKLLKASLSRLKSILLP